MLYKGYYYVIILLCTHISTQQSTLSAATILSPLIGRKTNENKTAHGFKDFCYTNLCLIFSCNMIDWRFDFNLFSKQEIFGRKFSIYS